MTTISAEKPTPRRSTGRLITLIVLGLVIIGSSVIWRYFRYARPIGTGPAGPAVTHSTFAAPWSQRPVVLLGLGDSITQGLGASPGHTYFQRLAKNPSDEFPDMQGICLSRVFPNLTTVNLAISGTTSIECVEHQLPKLTPYPPETLGVVVITTGGNDLIHNYGRTPPREGAMFGAKVAEIGEWVESYNQRLETIAQRVRETFPGGSRIYIANVYDPTDGDGDIEHAGLPPWPEGLGVVSAYNEVLTRFAERHDDVKLVDIRKAFLGHGIHCTHFWHQHYQKHDPYYWYWDNLEDPNDRGYDAIRRLFLMEMSELYAPVP